MDFCDDCNIRDEKVENVIISTINHKPQTDHQIERLFLDLDLSILGENWEVYEKYIGNVRKEYDLYSDEDFKKGRSIVMTKFLERDFIYYSEHFINLLEQRARENIIRELESFLFNNPLS